MCVCADAAPGKCDTGRASQYAGYKVTRVDIANPLGFIESWLPAFRSLHQSLTMKAGDPFSVAKFNLDSQNLSDKMKAGAAASNAPVKLTFTGGLLEDCDTTAQTLRVVYPIFSTVAPAANPPSIEQEGRQSANAAATAAAQVPADNRMIVTPLAGYNQTRAAFGGVQFSDTEGRLRIDGQTEDSANSQTSNLSLGSSLGANRIWNTATWKAALTSDKDPAGDSRYAEGKLAGQFVASTQQRPNSHFMFRYGATLEGGHQQSSSPGANVALMPDSSYGSLKLFAGVTGTTRRVAFSASYGFQLGDTFRTGVPVFSKHLVDLGYNYRIPVPFRKVLGDRDDFTGPLSASVHRTLGLETRFTAGLIQDAQGAPLAERFLGGNQLRPFVQDDTWIIPGDAFIRSIPENRLGSRNDNPLPATVPGGTRFYSANITLSFAAWGRPLIPKDLAVSDISSGPVCNPPSSGATPPKLTFPCVLNGAFQTAVTALSAYDKTHDPGYMSLTSKIPALAHALEVKIAALIGQLGAIPPDIASQDAVAQPLSDATNDAFDVDGALTTLEGGSASATIGVLAGKIPTFQTDMTALTKSLRAAAQTALADQFDQTVSALAQGVKDMQAIADQADKDFPTKKFDDEAWTKLAPGHRALDVLLNELNIYSIAPVTIFDVARVWPVGQGVRYGVGPGLRLSLVNVNFTLGYAYNPQRLPGEKPGAILFSLDVTELF